MRVPLTVLAGLCVAMGTAPAVEHYADVMAAQASVDGVLATPGEQMAAAVNTMAALERVCPVR
ncbi:hypothetical protein HNP40_001573 [Mycobacteroides chelonae]|nr:hypothetical protein [Mycobacteroides chelonae]